MAQFVLQPPPVARVCHWPDAKSKEARHRVHRTDCEADGPGATLCGIQGQLSHVGSAVGQPCQSCERVHEGAPRMKKLIR